MKISKAEFDKRVNSFILEVISTLPASHHKFIAGMALGSISNTISTYTSSLVGEDGFVDLDAIDAVIAKGFETSGGEVKFAIADLIPNDMAKSLFAGVVTTVRPDDIKKYMS